MDATIKALIAKSWKDDEADLTVGRHFFDEEIVVRVCGSVEKHGDQLAAPTVSIPLVTTLALFWEKAGFSRDLAMKLLREAITEAMAEGVNEDRHIASRIKDVEVAVAAIRQDLIAQLPKMKRSGRVITKDLDITVTPLSMIDESESLVAA